MKSVNLNKEVLNFIKNLESLDNPPLYSLTPDDARKFLVDIQRRYYKEIDGVKTEDIDIDGVSVRIYKTENKIQPAVIYLHGGGWILGDYETHDVLMKMLAKYSENTIFFVNYSRSPEAHYPIAVNESYKVLEYVFKHGKELYIDNSNISVAGDSAGGNMAAVLAIKSKKENGPKISKQLLLYPVCDVGMNTSSYNNFQDGPWLTKTAMEWFFDAYVPDKKYRKDIYVSPLLASREDLKGLPPALIVTAENDVLRDEGEEYARKLDDAGVETLCVRINGTHHDFIVLNALSDTPQSKFALQISTDFLRK